MRRLLDAFGIKRGERELPGRVIAHRYRVIESLDECGAGERFIAEDEASEERVMLLVLEPSFATNGVEQRLGQLDVAHGDVRILRPHDSGVDELGRPFTVTRFVDGELLSTRLERGAIAWAEAYDLIEDLAEMLAIPHQRRLVHGSLEPSRIVLGRGGPWLLDFGLARALGRPLGSVEYTAPEVLNGCRPSPLSDLYSLGLIIYAVVAGEPPFRGSMSEVIEGHRARSVPEIGRRGDAPVEVDALLSIALAKKPDERFSDTLELVETIRGIEASSSGVWRLSTLESKEPSLAPTTELGTMLRGFSLVELEAARVLIDKLIAARRSASIR